MSNQPDINNIQRSIRVPRDLDAKIKKRFRIDESMSLRRGMLNFLLKITSKSLKISGMTRRKGGKIMNTIEINIGILPRDLRFKLERIMQKNNFKTLKEAVLFCLQEVVSPETKNPCGANSRPIFFTSKVVSPVALQP